MTRTQQTDPIFYTEPEFCKLVGICLTTAWKLRNNGELQYIRIGKQIRYTNKHLTDFMANHERNSKRRK